MLLWLIILPVLAGLLLLILPFRRDLREAFSLLAAGAGLCLATSVFVAPPPPFPPDSLLGVDRLSLFIILFVNLFGFLAVLYSRCFDDVFRRRPENYAWLLISIGASVAVLVARDLVLLAVGWGVLGIALYLLIGAGPNSADAAKKTFMLVGGADAFLLLGVICLWQLSGSWRLAEAPLPLSGGLAWMAFVSLLIAALAKIGAFPLHSWVPDAAVKSPLPVAALLPAAIDKLVGVYLLARLCLHLFQPGPGARMILMVLGGTTVVAAVGMALVQHDARRLLGFHAVSQAGYMVMGIGSGTALGVAGALFHMLNNAVYKQGLFLSIGAVERREGTADLDRLGGLARPMPWTFTSFVIAALAISGVPPLNGFVSKWMIYQGLFEMRGLSADPAGRLWAVWLLAAMFGSALTLASFLKLLHAVFLGKKAGKPEKGGKEGGLELLLPMTALAALSVLFGIFAFPLVVRGMLAGAVPGLSSVGDWPGWWRPGPAVVLLGLGLITGWLIYRLGNLRNSRTDTAFVGGEKLALESRVTGSDFYNTIEEIGFIRTFYRAARSGRFDLYGGGKRAVLAAGGFLRRRHIGLLPLYLAWCLIGMAILFLVLMR